MFSRTYTDKTTPFSFAPCGRTGLFLALFLSLFLLTGPVPCQAASGAPLPSEAAGNRAASGPLRVALLLESERDDHGMAARLKAGLAKAREKAKGRIEVRVVEAAPSGDQTAIFRETAAQSDLVLVAEPRLHDILRDNAANYRKVSFGCIDTGVLGIRATNIMSVTFADQEAAFLAGAAAPLFLEPDQKLGWLETEATPISETLLAGFIAGTQVARPDVRIVRRETGGRVDEALLQDMTGQGVAVCLLATGYETPALLATKAAGSLLVLGLDPAQFALSQGRMPLAILKRYDRAVEDLVLRMVDGSFRGREILVYTLANGGVDLVLNRDFARFPGFPDGLGRRLKELRRELANGNITLEDKRIPTLCDCLD